MKKNQIILLVFSVILALAWLLKILIFKRITGSWAYLFWSTIWISAIMIIILTINLLISKRGKGTLQPPVLSMPDKNNRRASFRVTYPLDQRPTLIIDRVDAQARRHLEYPVIDLSEEGLCFMDDGSLGSASTIAGRLQFKSGAAHGVAGEIVRRRRYRISVRLIQSLAWSTLLNEQRQMLHQTDRNLSD